ncbi:MAG TPA: hypothetical protein PKD45_15050 [Flavobacteriales bacterium]|nr:hypothetical protein [Flavobacteriales bacterium]
MRVVKALRHVTQVVRAVGVFWPSAVLVVVLFLAFCSLDVGRDLVLLASERRGTLPMVLVTMVFAAFTVWYSGRLTGFAFLKTLNRVPKVSIHFPRFMGFSVFTVMAMAFTQGPLPALPKGRLWLFAAIVALSFGWYRFLVRKAGAYAKARRDVAHARKGLLLLFIGMALSCALSGIGPVPFAMVACILLAQFFYTLQVAARAPWAPLLTSNYVVTRYIMKSRRVLQFMAWVRSRLLALGNHPKAMPDPRKGITYFMAFNAMALIALGLFIAADTSLTFARWSQPLPIAITGIGVVLGIINLLRLFARLAHVGLFSFIVVLALVTGHFFDAHEVRHLAADTGDRRAEQQRPDFREAASAWMRHRLDQRGTDSIAPASRLPMIFVLSDGGGSRSGLWVTSVLGRLDADSQGRFREHLFCLSGASGGSVGNVTYYALLRHGSDPRHTGTTADSVLSGDFLSHTIARMLGNDLLNLICPALGSANSNGKRLLEDRAAALEDGLSASGRSVGLHLDSSITQWFDRDPQYPLLCINTTRMQDAKPGVISTFAFANNPAFSGRLDVLDAMDPARTLSASSCAMLSARFPYVSPAGGVPMGTDSIKRTDYFVDGGYFDNSGAGLVLEMLMELRHDTALAPLFAQFAPIVLHISNGLPNDTVPGPVNSVLNDLLAPVVTIAGAYGQQTDVNNLRLQRYMDNSSWAWYEVNLFKKHTPAYYPMSWVMSRAPRDSMRARVKNDPDIGLLATRLMGGGQQ